MYYGRHFTSGKYVTSKISIIFHLLRTKISLDEFQICVHVHVVFAQMGPSCLYEVHSNKVLPPLLSVIIKFREHECHHPHHVIHIFLFYILEFTELWVLLRV